MLQRTTITAAILLILLGIFVPQAVVQAVPQLPSSIYGTAQVNNTPVADGTRIQALIAGQVVAYGNTLTYQGNSVYALDIPGDDPDTTLIDGGKEGDTIQFTIGGLQASQTGTWHSGTNVEVNLTAISSNTPQPPQPTLTPYPTQTAIQVVQPSATLSVPSATLISPSVAPTLNTPLHTSTSMSTATSPAQTALAPTSPGKTDIFTTSTSVQNIETKNGVSSRRKAQNLSVGILILAVIVALVMIVRGRITKKNHESGN
jgi:hypothetical protein